MSSDAILQNVKNYELEWKQDVYFPFILRTKNCPWNWYFLSMNSNISLELILSNPTLPWEWDAVSLNPNLTRKLVLENKHRKWNLRNINNNPSLQNPPIPSSRSNDVVKFEILNEKIISSTQNTAWHFGAFCTNPSLTLELIESNLTKAWDWNVLSTHTFKMQMQAYVEIKVKEKFVI